MKNSNSELKNLFEKGKSYRSNKEFKLAVDCFDQVLEIDPKHISALFNKGNAYVDLKEY